MPKQLLLADDSITIQKVVTLTFANEDFRITAVSNGEDAVTRARALKPDIILADVVMPKLNGYEVCEAIKNDPALKHIPVLLLAGTFEAFDEGRARSAAADGHIVKPFESGKLIDHVKNLINGKGMQPAAAPAAGVSAVVAAPVAPRPAVVAPPAAIPAPPVAARPVGLPPPPAGLRPPGAMPPASGLPPPGGLRPPAGLPPQPGGLRPPVGLAPPAGLRPPSAGLQPPAGLKPPVPAPFQPPAGLRPPAPLGAPTPMSAPLPMAPPSGMGSSAIPAAPPAAPPKAQRDPFGLGLTIPTPRAPEPAVEAKPPPPPPASSVMMSPGMPEEDILFEDPSVEPVKAAPPPPPKASESELDFSSLNDVQPRPAARVEAKPASKPVPAFEPAHEPEISFDEEEVVAGEVVVEPPPPPPPRAFEAPRAPLPTPMPALAPTSPSLPSMQVRPPVPPTFTPSAGSDAQLEATLRDALSRASREMIERIAWEVVPQLAEAMIKAELERLMKDRQS
jgi:CheY-like chemotaxis protein